MKKIFPLLLCFLSLSMQLMAIEPEKPEGTGDTCVDPWLIATPGNLVWYAQRNNSGEQYSMFAKLTADIDLGDDQTMLGTSENPYWAEFDGNGHSITVNYTATEDYTALFRYVKGATIKNLHVKGNISTGYPYAGGMVAYNAGGLSIENCQCSVTITSTFTTAQEGFHGGIISYNNGTEYLTDVLFDGKLLGPNATNCGGMIGLSKFIVFDQNDKLKNCLFCPQEVTFSTTGACTFCRDEEFRDLDATNSYYSTAFGEVQGTEASASQLSSGEICYTLNNGGSNWYQTIGTDTYPVLDNTHATVYGGLDACPTGSTYSNKTHDLADSRYVDAEGYVYQDCNNEGCTGKLLTDAMVEAEYDETNDCYIINSLPNLLWLANQVNNGNTAINGKLGKDIDMRSSQTMIGTSTNKYAGTFDGGNYTINVNYTATENNTGLFRYVDGATIKNLKTAGAISTGYKFAGGVASYVAGATTINNCQSSVTITSTFTEDKEGTHGGIVGDNEGELTLSNSLFTGSLVGSYAKNCGGLVGWTASKATITGCWFKPSNVTFSSTNSYTMSRGNNVTVNHSYYTSAFGKTQGTATTESTLVSGEVCYNLNGGVTDGTQAWYQTLGTDDAPVFNDNTHGTVYGGTTQCPLNTYSNTNSSHALSSEDGISHCTNNGCTYVEYQAAQQDDSGYYLIGNKGNLIWFANQVNNGQITIKGKLTQNIDLGNNQTMIGTAGNPYCGTFDGDFHTITVHYNTSADYTALFRYSGKDGDYSAYATINNLNVAGTIETSAKYAGGFAASAYGIQMHRCHSSVDITSSVDGECCSSGFVAYDPYGSTLTNCLFDGSLTGENAYDWTGFTCTNNHEPIVSSCLFVPSAINISTTGTSHIMVSWKGGAVTTYSGSNTYYIMPKTYSGNITLNADDTNSTSATSEELSFGHVCYGLNGGVTDGTQIWYQTIGTDACPVYDSTHGTVYRKEHVCTAPAASDYSNAAIPTVYDQDGIYTCENCNTAFYQPCEYDGSTYYLISNLGNFIWFANKVKYGNNGLCGKLTADIDFGDNQTMIGTGDYWYAGTFDGDGHTITVKYVASEKHVGIFRYASGSTIQNLRTSGSINTDYQSVGGIVAYANGVNIINCECCVAITSTWDGDAYAGGIVGQGSAVTFTNVVFSGKLLCGTCSVVGGFIGTDVSGSTFRNCLFIPSEAKAGNSSNVYTFGKASTVSNCYYTNQLEGTFQGSKAYSDLLENGEICYELNNSVSDGTQAWYQNLNNGLTVDAYPVPFNTHGTVFKGDDACPSTRAYSNISHDLAYVNGYNRCQREGCAYHELVPFSITGNEYSRIQFDKIENTAGSITVELEYTGDPSRTEWLSYTYGDYLPLSQNETVYFRAKETDGKNTTFSVDNSNYIKFSITYGSVSTNGNVMSLLSSDLDATMPAYAFYGLFKDCTALTKAPDLGSESLSANCYHNMFSGCTGLTTAPELPATTLAESCYTRMFYGCTGIKSAPALPAEKVEKYSYREMFSGCSALETPPVISANEMGESSCYYMFSKCTSLKTPPALPAMTLASSCYYYMFSGCTALTSLPELPATTLAENCYRLMFDGCTNLKVNTLGLGTAWSIPASATTASNWNTKMFQNTGGNFTSNPEIGTTYYVLDKPYTREMSNNWGTLVLPFDIDYDAENTDYKLYYLSAASSDALTFTEYTSQTIAAGTPVVVKKLSGDAIEIEPASNSTFSTTITPSTTCTGWTMNGTYKELTGQTGMYFIAQNKFWWAESPISIAPFRAWFTTTSENAKSMTIQVADDSEVEAIGEITADGEVNFYDTPIYNIGGQRLNTPQRGQINIINGKKYLLNK